MPKFKNTVELHSALAQAAADWIETDFAYEAANGAELGTAWGSPIEERMFLGLAIAAQTNRYAVDLHRSCRDRIRLVLSDPTKPPQALIAKDDGTWEPYRDIPKRVGYAPHNALHYGFASGMYALRVYEQVEIRQYRADMLVEWTWDGFEYEHRGGELRAGEPHLAVIECDGHDYHERTKAQARHDRRRDRDMQGIGLPVLRFTGSEIFADPLGCGRQVINFFIDAMNRRSEREIGHAVLDRLDHEREG